jgi:hypothetical protein
MDRVWIFVFAAVMAIAVTVGLVRAAMIRHRKRQQRSMRDHLNRISHTYE